MKKKGTKLMAFLLAVVVVLSMVGCGKKAESEKTNNPVADSSKDSSIDKSETLTLDVFATQANYQGLQTGWYGKVIKDKFNIELNIIAPNIAGGGNVLYEARSAAGNLGDIVIVDNSKMKECVDAGLVMDISKYLEGKQNIAKYQVGIDNLKSYIGQDAVYALPVNASTQSPTEPTLFAGKVSIASYMPFDYYQELGCPEIKNEDDLLDVLKQMQENHPETANGKKTYAFSLFKDWDGEFMAMTEKLAQAFGYIGTTGSVWTNANATESQLLIDDNSAYYNALKLYFKANQLGLLDPDSSSQDMNTMFTKVTDKQIFYLWFAWMMGNYNSEERGNKGDGYAFVPVSNQMIVTDGFSSYGNGTALGIGSKAKDPERIMEFLDWTCSSEGINYYAGNIKDLTYEIIDGKQTMTDFGKNAWGDSLSVPDELGGGSYKDGFPQMNANIGNKFDIDPESGESYDVGLWETSIKLNRTLLDDNWEKQFGAPNMVDYLQSRNMLDVIPGCAYTRPTEDSELSNKRLQCGTLVRETSWKMVFAKDEAEFNQLWNDMKTQLTGFGYDDIITADRAVVEEIRASRAEAVEAAAK